MLLLGPAATKLPPLVLSITTRLLPTLPARPCGLWTSERELWRMPRPRSRRRSWTTQLRVGCCRRREEQSQLTSGLMRKTTANISISTKPPLVPEHISKSPKYPKSEQGRHQAASEAASGLRRKLQRVRLLLLRLDLAVTTWASNLGRSPRRREQSG